VFDAGTLLEVRGAQLFVSQVGYASAPPILLLHGGFCSRRDFEPLAQDLAPRHRLIALDTRGHGRSSLGQDGLSYEVLERDVADVIRQLGCGPVGVIGHSDGGITALRLAASGKVPLRFVVTVGAHWALGSDDPARTIYQDLTQEAWRDMFPDSVRAYQADNPDPDFGRLFCAVRHMWLGTGQSAYPGEKVRHIKCPLLAIRGDDDVLVSRANAVELVERVEGARLLNLPFAGHAALQEDLASIMPFLRSFMDQTCSR